MGQNGIKTLTTNFNRLPVRERKAAAGKKYAVAVAAYASSAKPISQIARECGVSARALSAYLGKHYRDLLYARYGLDENTRQASSFKVRPPRGQSYRTHLKYKEAIEACGDIAYIEFNISQIARMFHHDATALAAQLRMHYPDIIPAREQQRRRLGIADNAQRGPRRSSVAAYTRAVEMYRDTNLSIPEVARRCEVSESGFGQFMRFYHKEIIAAKARARKAAGATAATRKRGNLSANGRRYNPDEATEAQYTAALALYRSTGLTIEEIASRTGVPAEGFRGYLRRWHADDIDKTTRRPAAAKYAPAIASLRARPRPVAAVAAEFGLNPEVFRSYLKAHEPALAQEQGMIRLPGGKTVKKNAYEKYRTAIDEYTTSDEALSTIARRHGLTYNSLLNFIRRNCPTAREMHLAAVANKTPSHPINSMQNHAERHVENFL